MARKERFIVGLDLGSSKTCALVCHPGENGKLQVAGFGTVESKGWRKSVIANLDLAVSAVKKAVEAAETAAGISIDSAFVGVGGTYIKSVNSRGAVALARAPGATRVVTHEDVLQVFQVARGIALPEGYEIVCAVPQDYALDSQEGIGNPVGMSGSRLEGNVHLITGSSTALRNVETAANLAAIEVIETVYEPLASAAACLTADERELGVALADIGHRSTDMIVYSNGSVHHTASIPVGGDHFTNDIAVFLRTTISTAEKAKRTWSEHGKDDIAGAVLEVPGVGERPSRMVSYAELRGIMRHRADDLLELIQAELERSGHRGELGAGLVLVGGGAKQRDLVPLAEQTLSLPVRVGSCTGIENMGDQLAGPEYAALVGLVVYGNRRRLKQDSQETGFWARILGALRPKSGTWQRG